MALWKTQMPPVHAANLVANGGNTAYGVERIMRENYSDSGKSLWSLETTGYLDVLGTIQWLQQDNWGPAHIYNRNPFTDKTASLYWISPLEIKENY